MSLSSAQRRHLRALAHHLKPVVWMGQKGLTEAVVAEVNQALSAHELIKVKVPGGADEALQQDLCRDARAEVVSSMGGMLCLFRRNHDKPKIPLPPA